MSLPMTAVGPLKVETNPILMESPAEAGLANARAVAPASKNAVLIFVSLLIIFSCRQPSARAVSISAWTIRSPSDQAESNRDSISLFEHDLRANAARLSR